MRGVILLFIRCYRILISPFLPKSCRFYPTCSDYTFQAVKKFGVKKGIFLGFKRILRCNPFNSGGYDPIPKK